MYTIYLPVGCISEDYEKAKKYCQHFNCTIHKSKKGSCVNKITTQDLINFFWLGANINLQSKSPLTVTISEKLLQNDGVINKPKPSLDDDNSKYWEYFWG